MSGQKNEILSGNSDTQRDESGFSAAESPPSVAINGTSPSRSAALFEPERLPADAAITVTTSDADAVTGGSHGVGAPDKVVRKPLTAAATARIARRKEKMRARRKEKKAAKREMKSHPVGEPDNSIRVKDPALGKEGLVSREDAGVLDEVVVKFAQEGDDQVVLCDSEMGPSEGDPNKYLLDCESEMHVEGTRANEMDYEPSPSGGQAQSPVNEGEEVEGVNGAPKLGGEDQAVLTEEVGGMVIPKIKNRRRGKGKGAPGESKAQIDERIERRKEKLRAKNRKKKAARRQRLAEAAATASAPTLSPTSNGVTVGAKEQPPPWQDFFCRAPEHDTDDLDLFGTIIQHMNESLSGGLFRVVSRFKAPRVKGRMLRIQVGSDLIPALQSLNFRLRFKYGQIKLQPYRTDAAGRPLVGSEDVDDDGDWY